MREIKLSKKQLTAMLGATAAVSTFGVVSGHNVHANADALNNAPTATQSSSAAATSSVENTSSAASSVASSAIVDKNNARNDLNSAVANASSAGVKVTQGETESVSTNTPNDFKNATSLAAGNEQAQAGEINAVTAQQKLNQDTYAKNSAAISSANSQGNSDLKSATDKTNSLANDLKANGGTVSSEGANFTPTYTAVNSNDPNAASNAVQGNITNYQKGVSSAVAQQGSDQTALQQAINTINKNKADNAAKKAAYEKALADYEANKEANAKKVGNASEPITQDLLLGSEDNGVVSVTDSSGKPITEGPGSGFFTTQNANNVPVKYYGTGVVHPGDVITATYTNLNNSKYNGTKIGKLVRVIKVAEVPTGSDMQVWVPNDPSMGFWYGNLDNNAVGNQTLNVSDKLYDENGNPITLNGNAYISAGSLNNFYNHLEEVRGDNSTAVPINGSSIAVQSDGYAYSPQPNWAGAPINPNNTSEGYYPVWDSANSSNRYIGAIIYKVNQGANSIDYTAKTVIDHPAVAQTWFTTDTTNLPVVAQPQEPTYASETANVTVHTPTVDNVPTVAKPDDLSASYHYVDTSYKEPIHVTTDKKGHPIVTVPKHNNPKASVPTRSISRHAVVEKAKVSKVVKAASVLPQTGQSDNNKYIAAGFLLILGSLTLPIVPKLRRKDLTK